MPPATWHWMHNATLQPLHCSPLQLIHPQRVHTYLRTRDPVWHSADLPPRWVLHMVRVAGSYSVTNKALSAQASCVTVWTNAGTATTAPMGSKTPQKLLQLYHALTALSRRIRCTQSCTVLTKTSTPCAELQSIICTTRLTNSSKARLLLQSLC